MSENICAYGNGHVRRPERIRFVGDDGELDMKGLMDHLVGLNRLAREHGFGVVSVSDLDGFADHLQGMQDMMPLVAVSDTSAGSVRIHGAPVTRRIKTVFLFIPHSLTDDYAERRAAAMAVLRELFRQLMTVMCREDFRLRLGAMSIDDDVTFEEIDEYFYSGGACAYYNIVTERRMDLCLRPDDWVEMPL